MLFDSVSIFIIILALSLRQLNGLQTNKTNQLNTIKKFNYDLLTSGNLSNAQLREVCGISNVTRAKIWGGENATVNAWPWMVAVLNSGGPFCGGALISYRFVLTADHCVRNNQYILQPAKNYAVRVGELDFNSKDDGAQPVDYKVKKLIDHQNYKKFDIVMMELSENVKFSQAAVPICLPDTPDLINSTYVDKHPFVTGWGSLHSAGNTTTVLQQVQIDVYPVETCHKKFEEIVCAGKVNGEKSACPGDSGGPLMTTNSNNQMSIIGIVSKGGKCEKPSLPAYYTRVATHIDWIKKIAGMV